MIPPETVRNILETAQIEDVVGDFVLLKKRGVNLIGLCPFHNEKTPSFTVSPSKNIFKCFGCGKAGNSLKFIMEHEHFTYPEALRYLARKYNIEIEEEEQTPEQVQAMNEQESLFAVSLFAQKFFTDSLFGTEEGKAIGLTYFRERGFDEVTIRKFQLGYSPDKWDGFTGHAVKNGYKTEYLEKTGLSIGKEGQYYDRFRARVMFPVHNLSGRVIGFGGRTLSTDKTKPKYVNSPESSIYHKGSTLYGLFFAKNSIIAHDNCYLVEGYTDVISLHQAGIENVVASSGTSLTTDQIRLIKRYTPNITILYDGDEAGLKASFRGTDLILEQGMNVRIVLFPQGEDPDSYARKKRPLELQEFIHDTAVNFILFKTNLLLQEAADDPVKRASLIRDIVGSIALIPDALTRIVYIRECSKVMAVGEQALMNELNKALRKNYELRNRQAGYEYTPEPEPVIAEKQIDVDNASLERQERDLVRLLLLYSRKKLTFEEENEDKVMVQFSVELARFIINELKTDEMSFAQEHYRMIFREFESHLEHGFIPDDQYFINNPDSRISETASQIVISPYLLSPNWELMHNIPVLTEELILKQIALHDVNFFKLKKIDQLMVMNREQLKAPREEGELTELMSRYKKLMDLKKNVSAILGITISK